MFSIVVDQLLLYVGNVVYQIGPVKPRTAVWLDELLNLPRVHKVISCCEWRGLVFQHM